MGKFTTPIEALELRRLLSAILRVDANSIAPNPDGATWDTAYPSLQQALAAANFGDEIRVADGTYKPTASTDPTKSFLLKDGVALIGGFAGSGATDPDQRNITSYRSVLSGNVGGTKSYHVVIADHVGTNTILDGFSVSGGAANGVSFGGGLYSNQSGLTVRSCTFEGNFAWGGGAFANFNDPVSDKPVLIGCQFNVNQASSAGGAIYSDGGGLGGLTLTDCSFIGNTSVSGGAAFLNGRAMVTRCTFVRNRAMNSGSGGALRLNQADVSIDRSSFFGNRAFLGGGIGAESGTVLLTNSAFVGNSLSSTNNTSGGGLYTHDTTPTVVGCTFTRNSAGSFGGGALAFHATTLGRLHNSVLWSNGGTGEIYSQFILSSVTNNDVTGGYAGTGNINADPQFVRNPSPGADNTWGTADDDYGDLRLQITSPCIDAGDNASVPTGVTTDIAGRPRFFDFPGVNDGAGAIVDMGANELDLRLGLLRVAAGQTLVLPAGRHTFFVEQFDLQPIATLDMRDDSLIIDYTGASELAAAQAFINSGRAGGAWTGTGITSDSAKNNTLHNTTLGAIEASDFKSIYGNNGAFGGHVFDSSAVLVKYTYYGDTDFNGVVNFDDYSRTDAGFVNHRTGWLNGDFDGNGVVNFDDYSLIDLAFSTQAAQRRGTKPGGAAKVPNLT